MKNRFLAIDPTRAGFAYAVLEAPERLLDWGLATSRDEISWAKCLERLIARYSPSVLVTEDSTRARRGRRALELLDAVETLALLRNVWTVRVPKEKVRELFPDACSKHDVAVALAERFPELRPRLPKKRKPWTSEDPRLRIFDALALLMAHLAAEDRSSN
ncbi:MAG TPA: hypothetical protein VGP73_18530 [Thermoanaerobaculia bacterium]